jgi:nitrite reductase (NO-forming)
MFRRLCRVVVLAGAAVLVATACTTQRTMPGWTYGPTTPTNRSPGPAGQASGAPAAGPSVNPGAAASTGADGATGPALGMIKVRAIDLGFDPKDIHVDKAGVYAVELQNSGALPHDITFADGTKAAAKAGETVSVNVNVPADGTTFLCSVPGHADAGMKGSITLTGTAAGGTSGGDHGGPAPATDTQPDANAPAYTLREATAPKALAGTTHDIDLVIQEKLMTVAKGFVQAVWTFGGTVPGPVIRVKVGDTVRIHLKNPATNQLPHSVDFHASQVAWNDEMTSIDPGKEKIYEWRADYAGVWMYHCGTSPALHHIANGMYGMVIVEPRDGLKPVDTELAVVQSEWYLGAQQQPVSLSKAAAASPAPDFVVFNGIANQYVDNPIAVKTGGRVRVFVLDAGPSVDSSFHVVGTIFNSVVKEGVQLLPNNPGGYGSQAMDLAPAQGGFVEFTMPEDGLYPMVTHAFNFVGRGALGLLKAGDGDPLK